MFYLDLPGREDCAEDLEGPDVHAMKMHGHGMVGQTNAKASGGEFIDVKVFLLRPWSRVKIIYVRPRTHAVRII